MQRIERYGVIALVFLLVTIVAVSLWGEQRKSGGLFQFLKRDSKSAQVDRLLSEAPQSELPDYTASETRTLGERNLPFAPEASSEQAPPAQTPPGILVPSPTQEGLAGERESAFEPEKVPEHVAPIPDPLTLSLPKAESAPPPAKPSTYTVRKGDTLGQIAQRELGSVKRLPELLELNPKVDPRKLQAGHVLRLPVSGGAVQEVPVVAEAAAPKSIPLPAPEPKTPQQTPAQPPSGRSYTVRDGDTLGQIAQRELGTVKRMGEILALNKGLDPNHLIAGRTLVLPPGAPPARSEQIAKADSNPQASPVQSTPARSKVR